MKILKRILLALLGIIVLCLVLALFMKKEYHVEREVIINKPEQEVFDYVKLIKNQDYFSEWNMADPNKKQETSGTDGTVGFIYKWEGNDDVGAGEQKITNVIEDERVDVDLHFIKPFENDAKAYIATEAVSPNETKVKWAMYGESSYPMNFMNFTMNSMLGDTMEKSLGNLKTILEK